MSGGDALVAAATAGDESAFAVLSNRHRHELQVHCYRMLGSFEEAEDLVQETYLRAWRKRATFEGRSSYKAWLYRIATNACLDSLRRNPQRVIPRQTAADASAPPYAEIPWLQPYPDRLLEQAAPSQDEPEASIVAKETIELAFLAAIQLLPPTQRAVLLMRDVLGWSAADTADLLETSVAAANSSLQRARARMREHRPARRADWAPPAQPSDEERVLLQRYIDAHERADAVAITQLLREDVRITMPPLPTRYDGLEAVTAFFGEVFGAGQLGDWRLVPTRANRQPAAANYLRRWGDDSYRALALDVLHFEDGALVEITVFEPHLFAAFGLPETR